jgi:hypothetical protein
MSACRYPHSNRKIQQWEAGGGDTSKICPFVWIMYVDKKSAGVKTFGCIQGRL